MPGGPLLTSDTGGDLLSLRISSSAQATAARRIEPAINCGPAVRSHPCRHAHAPAPPGRQDGQVSFVCAAGLEEFEVEQPLAQGPQLLGALRVHGAGHDASQVCPVRHGRLADLLGYDRRDVAVLAVDATLAVEPRARSTPHDRGRALRDRLQVAVGIEDRVPVFADDARCFEILPRDVPFEPCAGDATGVEGEGPDAGVLAALVELELRRCYCAGRPSRASGLSADSAMIRSRTRVGASCAVVRSSSRRGGDVADAPGADPASRYLRPGNR